MPPVRRRHPTTPLVGQERRNVVVRQFEAFPGFHRVRSDVHDPPAAVVIDAVGLARFLDAVAEALGTAA